MKPHRTFRTQHGFITIWILGICLLILGVGAFSITLWQGITERRQLSAITDAAATAAATEIDLVRYGQQPSVLAIDRTKATARALTYLEEEAAKVNLELLRADITFEADDRRVVIETEQALKSPFLKTLDPTTSLTITVRSAAEPMETL